MKDKLKKFQSEKGLSVVTFGEIMVRIAPPSLQTFRQALPGMMEFTFGGAEGNVAASLAILGRKVRFMTALPEHAVSDSCVSQLKGLGVDTDYIARRPYGRQGIYFLETGANQRPSKVIYDREHSLISELTADQYDFEGAFSGAGWLHLTGITPALSAAAAESVIAAARIAHEKGLIVSCDLNYRGKLWKWNPEMSQRELAGHTMRQVLPYVDLVIANEEDAKDVLGIAPGNVDVTSGKLDVARYKETASEIVSQFPNISMVAITLRESVSASHNNWGALLYETEGGQASLAPLSNGEYTPYEIRNIVDRVGGGDSFGAGLIFALTDSELSSSPATALSFAVASSCLCQSIPGDINFTEKSEVLKLMGGDGSGRVQR